MHKKSQMYIYSKEMLPHIKFNIYHCKMLQKSFLYILPSAILSNCFKSIVKKDLLKDVLSPSLYYFIAFQETDVFQFEMDESQLSNVLSSIDEIEQKLASYAQ